MASIQADKGEHMLKVTSEHWVKYVVPVTVSLFLFVVSLLLFLLAGVSAHHYMWLSHGAFLGGLLLFLFTFHWFFMMLLSEELNAIIVTNRRLLRLNFSLIFQEDILEVSFDKMKTVDARKEGLFQNLLHYGTLYFETKLAAVPHVPHPNRMARIIQDAMLGK